MRIAVISNALSSAQGGAGAIATRYAELLKARGHEVRTWGASADFARLGTLNVLQRLWFHCEDFFPQRNIVEAIQLWKPDVLLTHNLMGCGFTTSQALHASGLRWVHVLHDVQLVEPSGQIVEGESFRFLKNIRRGFLSAVRQVLFGRPDVVVSPTQWLLDFHKKYGWFSKSVQRVIPNPLSGSCPGGRFSLPAIRRDEKTSAGSPAVGAEQMGGTDQSDIAGDAGNVLSSRASSTSRGIEKHSPRQDPRVRYIYVGRLDPDKGIDLLLEAWKKRAETSATLTIVGDGSWREKIVRAQAQDTSIQYKGPLPHEDVQKLFAGSDVAVIPSRVWENQPTVILEALSAGCRVVATDVGGISETLQKAGWIVLVDSVDALVQGMDAAGASVIAEDSSVVTVESTLKLHDPEVVVVALESALKSNL